MIKNLLATFLVTLLCPLITSAQMTVPAGGTGLTSVPHFQVVVGNTSLHLTSMATSSLGLPTFGGTNSWTGINTFVAGWAINATSTGTFGINISGGCFAINGTCIGAAGGVGTVTSIATTYPLQGGPITTSGTLTLAFSTTTANTWSALNIFNNSSSTLLTCTTCWVGTLGQALNANNFLINNVLSPVSGGDAANKTYVDNAVAGVNPAVAVQAATTQASDTSSLTYSNGASGIGATFTGSINTPITIDGVSLNALGKRLLVKNDTQSPSGAFNGVYYITVISTAGTAPVFTRALDYDMPSDINNTGAIPVVGGTSNASTQWVITSSVTTVGTDALTYTQFSLNPSTIFTTAGTGLRGSGNTVSLKSYFGTSTADTTGQVLYWNSTGATPALLTSASTFTFDGSKLILTNGSTTNLSAATALDVGGVNVSPFIYSSYDYATSTTAAGTTTRFMEQAFVATTYYGVKCNVFPSGATWDIQIGNGTASTTMVVASSTNNSFIFATPASFAAGSNIKINYGTPASSPIEAICTTKRAWANQ